MVIPFPGDDAPSRVRLVWTETHELDYVALVQGLDGDAPHRDTASQALNAPEWGRFDGQAVRGSLIEAPFTVSNGMGASATFDLSTFDLMRTDPGFTYAAVLEVAGELFPSQEGGRDVPGAASRNLTASPNPFNPSVSVAFTISAPGSARLVVYNSRGELVRTLVDRDVTIGAHRFEWDGRGDNGSRVASGVYYAALTVGRESDTVKMLLLK